MHIGIPANACTIIAFDPLTSSSSSLFPPEALQFCHDLVGYKELVYLGLFGVLKVFMPRHWSTDDSQRKTVRK